MISQINDFKKIIFILNIKKFDLVKILFLILLATAIELLGLSIVIPFINQTFGLENEYYNDISMGVFRMWVLVHFYTRNSTSC